MEIKPIETRYNGFRFRSRLEARWAVFFDCIGIKYEYEPEGYEFNESRYLPDFYLPEYNCYFEVKKGGLLQDDGRPSNEWYESPEGKRICEFVTCIRSQSTEYPKPYLILASGDPWGCLIDSDSSNGLVYLGEMLNFRFGETVEENEVISSGKISWPVKFGKVKVCLLDDSEYNAQLKEICIFPKQRLINSGLCGKHVIALDYANRRIMQESKHYRFESVIDTQIHRACINARVARFEHGEKPGRKSK